MLTHLLYYSLLTMLLFISYSTYPTVYVNKYFSCLTHKSTQKGTYLRRNAELAFHTPQQLNFRTNRYIPARPSIGQESVACIPTLPHPIFF